MARTPLLVLLFAALFVSACAAVQPGRSVGRQVDDFNASLAVKSAMLRSEGYALDQVDVEITEGVMLLTGSAPRDADRIYAECLAWSAPGVRSVVNEIEVGAWRSPRVLADDQRITQQVRVRLVQDPEVRSVNFNIETREGAVYLLGYARDRGEADHAARLAAQVGGVARVVDLVRVTGETPDLPARGALQAEACDAATGPAPSDPADLDGAPVEDLSADAAPRTFQREIDRTAPAETGRPASPDATPF